MRSFLLLHEPGDTLISQGDPTHRYNSTSAKKKSFMMLPANVKHPELLKIMLEI